MFLIPSFATILARLTSFLSYHCLTRLVHFTFLSLSSSSQPLHKELPVELPANQHLVKAFRKIEGAWSVADYLAVDRSFIIMNTAIAAITMPSPIVV